MGAIASGGIRIVNEDVVRECGITDRELATVAATEERELERRERRYRGERPRVDGQGCTVILVDDGLATGSTTRAAVAALRQDRPSRIVVAVPVAAPETCALLRRDADVVVCAITPEPFHAVGLWYDNFAQTSDDEVRALLAQRAGEYADQHGAPPLGDTHVHQIEHRGE